MASVYAAFRRSPSAAQLAPDATLSYITSTTAIHEAAAIVKHLTVQQKMVEQQRELILSTVERPESLLVETETQLRFVQGGGAYLPSLDENLLDEKVVRFPLLHVVAFDADRKIKQIRLYWDQGTLLRQVDAIGRTGRNWPIRDGTAQTEAILKSVRASGLDVEGKRASGARSEVVVTHNPKRDTVGALRNQPANLSLFNNRDPNENMGSSYDGPKTAPRDSARPDDRAYGDLFVGDESAASGSITSPSKSGAGKHYNDNRLFDETSEQPLLKSPEQKKTYGQKYEHFDFGDGEDAPQPDSRPSTRSAKNQANFSFEDFTTPLKYRQKKRPDDEVHWGGEVDPPTPPERPIVHAPRKDADVHFTLTDEATPRAAAAAAAPSRHNTTSTDNTRRGNDFASHYDLDGKSDDKKENSAAASKKATRSDLDSHWNWGTPEPVKKIYKTAGDGMGSRTGTRAWMIGDEGTE